MTALRITGAALVMALLAGPAFGAGTYAPGYPIGEGRNETGAIPIASYGSSPGGSSGSITGSTLGNTGPGNGSIDSSGRNPAMPNTGVPMGTSAVAPMGTTKPNAYIGTGAPLEVEPTDMIPPSLPSRTSSTPH